MCYDQDMKLSVYARKLGISYRTAHRWFKAGKVPGYQADTGTIIVTDPLVEVLSTTYPQKVAIYTLFLRPRIKTIWKARQSGWPIIAPHIAPIIALHIAPQKATGWLRW